MPPAPDSPATGSATPDAVHPPRWVLPTVAVPIAMVVIAGYIAGGFWATLVEDHPLVLIALSPINRYLLLVSNNTDVWSYATVGMLRHLFPDPFFYLLGYWYGARAVAWATQTYPALGKIVGTDGRGLESAQTRRIVYPLAFFAPNNWVSLLAGASRINVKIFLALNVAGTAARLIICRIIGNRFEPEIESIANWIARYQLPITVVSVIVVMTGIAIQFRRGSGEVVGLSHLDEMDDDFGRSAMARRRSANQEAE